jgi:hypothetical protein
VVVLALALVTGIIGGALFWRAFPRTPIAREDLPGGIVLLFDRPELDVTVHVEARADGHLRIEAHTSQPDPPGMDSSEPGASDQGKPRMLALFSGSAVVTKPHFVRGLAPSHIARLTLKKGATATADDNGPLYGGSHHMPNRYYLDGYAPGDRTVSGYTLVRTPNHIETPGALQYLAPDYVDGYLESKPVDNLRACEWGRLPRISVPSTAHEHNFRWYVQPELESVMVAGHNAGEWFPARTVGSASFR